MILEEEKDAETRGEVLRLLCQAYGEEATFQWGVDVVASLQQAEVLQQRVHEGCVSGEAEDGCELDDNTLPCAESVAGWMLRDLWEREECGCPSQGWESAEQRFEQSAEAMPELPFESASACKELFYLWSQGERLWLLQQALHQIQKIRESVDCAGEGGDGMSGVYIVRRYTPL